MGQHNNTALSFNLLCILKKINMQQRRLLQRCEVKPDRSGIYIYDSTASYIILTNFVLISHNVDGSHRSDFNNCALPRNWKILEKLKASTFFSFEITTFGHDNIYRIALIKIKLYLLETASLDNGWTDLPNFYFLINEHKNKKSSNVFIFIKKWLIL